MKVALLCSGLGRVHRGHEVFARDLFALVGDAVDMTLFKGGGEPAPRERVIDNIPRDADCLDGMHLAVSPKWREAAQEQERLAIEGATFAHAALKPLLEGRFDVVHCLEQKVCNIVYAYRHLFARTPAIVFSNGGAIAARDLPDCDFVQEHTGHNLEHSAKHKAFMIPHGVDVRKFRPGIESGFRERHGIPHDALLVISVGSIGYHHKRMDHVVREVAAVEGAWLLIAGQRTRDTTEIEALGHSLMGDRVIFTTLPHDALPAAYAAADVFTLGSLFETFGIAYIEAMAMGLPVICTDHVNQRSIVKDGGIPIDMNEPGALTRTLRDTSREALAALGRRGREVVLAHYDLDVLRQHYIDRYALMAAAPGSLPQYGLRHKLVANARNSLRSIARLAGGRAE